MFFSNNSATEKRLLADEVKRLEAKLGCILDACASISFMPDGTINDASQVFLSLLG
jgi:hypothetical protein